MPGVKVRPERQIFCRLIGFWGTTDFLLRGQAPPKEGKAPEADNRVVTPDYPHTMGIPLISGRSFTSADRKDTAHVIMINQKLARQYFKDKDPVSQQLNLGSAAKPDWWQIVGVVGDVKAFGQDQPTHLDIYQPFDQQPYPIVAFTLKTEGDTAAMIKAAESTPVERRPQSARLQSHSDGDARNRSPSRYAGQVQSCFPASPCWRWSSPA